MRVIVHAAFHTRHRRKLDHVAGANLTDIVHRSARGDKLAIKNNQLQWASDGFCPDQEAMLGLAAQGKLDINSLLFR